MSFFSSPRFLRKVLVADAASCLATGAVQALVPDSLPQMLALPAGLLAATGWFLLAYGFGVGLLATRDPLPRALVWLLVGGNLAWGAACVLLLAGQWLAPNAWGAAWIAAQAVIVTVLALLQWTGLRRGERSLGLA